MADPTSRISRQPPLKRLINKRNLHMKRSLLFAALATLGAGAAMAQSSVTVYGRLNLTVENERWTGSGGSQWNLNNNASRIGFKGVEDLGGGLKAGFQIEHGFSPDTGTQSQAAFWARQSEVNLGGNFGMVRLGNYTSEAYYATADYVSMHNHDTGNSADVFYAYVGRNIDKVGYVSPAFGGATFHAAVSAVDGGSAAAPGARRNYDLAMNWDAGPLHVGAGFERGNGSARQFAVRALYEMGPFTIGGYVQRDRDGFGPGLGDRTTLRLAGMYTMGSTEFHANWGRAGDYDAVPDSAANQFTLAVNHNLSKRTKVYGYFTKVADDALVYHKGPDYRAFALGVRHNF
jgi:predicted porin